MTNKNFSMERLGSEYVAPSVELAEISVERGFEVSDPYSMSLEDYATGEFDW
jgi:hypothetical protein